MASICETVNMLDEIKRLRANLEEAERERAELREQAQKYADTWWDAAQARDSWKQRAETLENLANQAIEVWSKTSIPGTQGIPLCDAMVRLRAALAAAREG